MKVAKSTITKITISEVPRLDPVTVILEDLGPHQGKVIIECFGQSWSAYWGGMGGRTIAQFLLGCDQHYIAGRLSSLKSQIFDPEALIERLKQELINERRKLLLSKDDARTRFDKIEELNPPDNEAELWLHATELQELIGDEWWFNLPTKTNPDYDHLCRIVLAMQDGIRMLSGPALAAA